MLKYFLSLPLLFTISCKTLDTNSCNSLSPYPESCNVVANFIETGKIQKKNYPFIMLAPEIIEEIIDDQENHGIIYINYKEK